MENYVYAFCVSLGTMILLDAAWLGLVAPAFYKKHIGFIMSDTPNWVAVVLFYVIFVIGMTVFVVYPGWMDGDSHTSVARLGALYGLVTYATYDLINQASLKKWPLTVTIVDLAWGILLTTATSIAAVDILKILFK